MSEVEIVNTNPYPQLVLSLSNQYPAITVNPTADIVLGSGDGRQGEPGPRGSTGATGSPGSGYTGAFISGLTLYMTPVVNGVEQAPVAIGTISSGTPSETKWDDATLTNTTVGGLNSGANLVGQTAIQILKEILYSYESVSFTAFTVNLSGGNGDRELGQTIGAATRSASWTTSGPTYNWLPGTLKIVRTVNGGSSTEIYSGGDYDSSPVSISHPLFGYSSPTNLAFTISGDQEEGADAQILETYSWKYKMYWGMYEDPQLDLLSNFNSFSSAFVSSTPNTTRAFSNNTGIPKYFYFVVPMASGFAEYTSFKSIIGSTQNDMPFVLPPAQLLNFTNPYSVDISYKVYRSQERSAIESINILPST
jgi:hypothetical protein